MLRPTAPLRALLALAPAAFVAASACGGEEGGAGPEPVDAAVADRTVPEPEPPVDAAPADAGIRDAGPPNGQACLAELDRRGIPWKPAVARGVDTAVNVTGPINEVLFANGTATTPSADPMACRFVLALWDFAALLKERSIHRVGTLGSYCYRCCCAWSQTNFCRGVDDPEPACGTSGYSNHSWGRAVDVRYLYLDNGTRFDVNDPTHWVISTKTTCGAAKAEQTGVSAAMYDIACSIGAAKIFSQVLTPNWNEAHRNHFHMDIGAKGEPSGFVVRALAEAVDPPTSRDACGDE